MNRNDILRRLRYIVDYTDAQMIQAFNEGGLSVSREQVSNWLKRDDDEQFEPLDDLNLAGFLNGLIVIGRGPREGGTPAPEDFLTNNAILTKLKIAFNQQSDDILLGLESVDFIISKHELSALFRKSDHKHYRICQAQLLRKYLTALQLQYRDDVLEENT